MKLTSASIVATTILGLLGPAAPAAGVAASPSEADPGLIGLRLLDAPVVRRDDPRAMTYIVDHLKPGTTIKRRLEVSNKSSVRRTVDLYAAAASITKNRFTFADGRRQNDLTGWTHIKPSRRTVAPHGRYEATVTIKVPKTAKPGERYGVLWAESTERPDWKHGIGIVSRVGVRVYLDVARGGEYTDFRIDKLVAGRTKKGRPRVMARVHNTGKRALDLEGRLRLTDGPGSLTAGPYPIRSGTTLPPGGTGTVTVNIPQTLPAGPWTAELSLQSGTVKHKVKAELTFPRPGTTVAARLLQSSGLNTWYGAGAALALLLGSAGLAAVLRRRLRRRQT